jgi:preprotein translocase subunit SecF
VFELIRADTHIDFIGRRRLCGIVSAALLLAGALAIPVQGVKLGIDFAGGTEMQVKFHPGADASEGSIREVASGCGIPDPSVVRYGEADADEFLIRFKVATVGEPDLVTCPLSPEQQAELAAAAEAGGGMDVEGEIVDRLGLAMGNTLGGLDIQRVEFVGPRVGSELRRDGITAIGVACLMILIYISFRFSLRFAPGAVVALIHDIGITAGLFVIFGLEFDLRVLAALLAIMGYSLNDTIIIYDRIRENMELRTKFDLVDVLNRSVNQTLSRTVLTSGTTLAAVLALLILGGESLRPFAIAMTIGIFVGTYSSVFIAAPTLLLLENWMGGGSIPSASSGSPSPAAPTETRPRPSTGGTGGRDKKTGKTGKTGKSSKRKKSKSKRRVSGG